MLWEDSDGIYSFIGVGRRLFYGLWEERGKDRDWVSRKRDLIREGGMDLLLVISLIDWVVGMK